MKFAIFALLANASALSIRERGAPTNGCLTSAQTDPAYKSLDTNGDGHLDYKEMQVAAEKFAAKFNYKLTKDDWEWLKTEGTKIDTKDPGVVDKSEFLQFANAMAEHFQWCKYLTGKEKMPNQGGDSDDHCKPLTEATTTKTFDSLDKNKVGALTWPEAAPAFGYAARNAGLQKADWHDIWSQFQTVQSAAKTVDQKGFNEMVNWIQTKYLCKDKGDDADAGNDGDDGDDQGQCVAEKDSDNMFDHIAKIRKVKALEWEGFAWGVHWSFSKAGKDAKKLSKQDWGWLWNKFHGVAGKGSKASIDKSQFNQLMNETASYFLLCPETKGDEPEPAKQRQECQEMSLEKTNGLLKYFDQNKDGKAEYDEIMKTLEGLLKKGGKPGLTPVQGAYVEGLYDGLNDNGDGLSGEMFNEFANISMQYYYGCKKQQ